MASNYTIGRLAKAARLPTTTLRYYERIGLLAACGRSESNYRLYDQAALERLLFIRAAQQSGFTLDDVSALIAVGDGIACRQVQGLIKHRLAELDARIRKLADVRRTLERTLSQCLATERPGTCQAVVHLKKAGRGKAPSPTKKRR